jgi:hypothetical protein
LELQKLLETYDFIPPPIESGSAYYFTTDSGIQYEVRFGRKQNNVLNTSIVFGVLNEEFDGEEYSMTNKFEVYKVMSTIVKIVQRYIQTHPKTNCYEFTGEPTEKEIDNEGRIRLKLYNRYLPYIFDNNWEIRKEYNKTIVSKINTNT